MSDDVFVTLDIGTQSARALAFDIRGTLVASARTELHYESPQAGWHECDPETFWRALCRSCNALWAADASLVQRTRALSITTQRATAICVDRDGNAIGPAITWLDQRKATQTPRLPPYLRAAFSLGGLASTVAFAQSQAPSNWLAQHEPEIWRRTHKYLMLSGYLLRRLTGEFIDSSAAAVGYVPFDYRKLRWASAGDWRWHAFSLEPARLPRLIAPATIGAQLHSRAADEIGLPTGTPVAIAAADKACEVLGSGALRSDQAGVSFGTAATINVPTPRYVEALAHLPAYPAAVPYSYLSEVQIFRGFWMVNWFKEQFGQPERERAARDGAAPEALFDELVEAVPPGAMGLMLQPFWSPALRMPEAKGAIIGFGDVHTRAHLYRAILEGLAFGLRDGLHRIEQRTATPVTELRAAGGGSQSNAALQIAADVFGLPVLRSHVHETSGLGAAIDCAVALGVYRDAGTAVAAMAHVSRTFEPQRESVELYAQLYEQVYKPMYRRLKPLYEAIRRITGYPR